MKRRYYSTTEEGKRRDSQYEGNEVHLKNQNEWLGSMGVWCGADGEQENDDSAK